MQTRPLPPHVEPPESISVTALLNYDQCPALFYLKHRLGVDPEKLATPGEPDLAPVVGTTLHQLLALGGEVTADRIRQAVAQNLWSERVFDEAIEKRLCHEVADMHSTYRNSILCKEVETSRQVRSEVGFAVMIDGTRLEGQIDKLLLNDGGYAIIDFKSGKPHPENPARYSPPQERYRKQLDLYAAAIDALGKQGKREVVIYHAGDGACWRSAPALAETTKTWAGKLLKGIAENHYPRKPDCSSERCPYHELCHNLCTP
jgi:ATP-dependent exoDNAse (exonuclease V) beta subunit